jgi:hypothetical protein
LTIVAVPYTLQGGCSKGRSTDHQEDHRMTRALDVVSVNAACRQLKVRADYLQGILDGMGIEPTKVRQLPVLSPEQFDQVKARVEGVRNARAK